LNKSHDNSYIHYGISDEKGVVKVSNFLRNNHKEEVSQSSKFE